MIYPEIPKSKRKSTYIVGGIFALFVGLIIFVLFLPGFLDKNFGFKPWDWATIIPNMTTDSGFFGGVSTYMQILLPIIFLLCAIASFFMGLSKSSGLFKGSILCMSLALVLCCSLKPAQLSSNITNLLVYVEYALVGIAFILAIVATILRFVGDEPYAPFHANSFHFFASFGLIIVGGIFIFANILNIESILNNPHYYFGAVFGLFLLIASVWMFITSPRDQSEFGLGYEREGKKKKEKGNITGQPGQQTFVPNQNVQQPQMFMPNGQPMQNPQMANFNQNPQQQFYGQQFAQNPQYGQAQNITPQTMQNPQMQQNPNMARPQQMGMQQNNPPIYGQNPQPEPQQNPQVQPQPQPQPQPRPMPQQPQQPNQNIQQPRPVPQQPIQPRPTMPQQARPQQNPQVQRPAQMPPRVGPDGRPIPPMPPRIGPDGRPLPPMPPRPMNGQVPPQTTNQNKNGNQGNQTQ